MNRTQKRLYKAVVAALEKIACPWCGKTFRRGRLNQIYCSVDCKDANWKARWRRARKSSEQGGSDASDI